MRCLTCSSMVTQSCPILCDPMSCSPSISSVHGILQASILQQVAVFPSRGSSWPRDQTHVSQVSCVGRWILYHGATCGASLVAQTVKNLPAVREALVPPLGWEDPLEEGMATHSSILAWRIPTDRRAWRFMGHDWVSKTAGHDWMSKHSTVPPGKPQDALSPQ